MTDSLAPRPPLGVGSLLGDSFSLVFRNLVPMMILGGVPAVIGIVMNLAVYGAASQNMLLALTDPMVYAATVQPVSTGMTIVVTVVGIALWGIAIAAMTSAAYVAASGNPVSVAAALGVASKRLVMVVICMIIAGLAAYLGLILLILPGLYLMALWFVLVPVVVVESKGLDALGRSAELTKEYRWPLVGLLVLFILIVLVISTVSAGGQALGYGFGTVGVIVGNGIAAVIAAFYYALAGALGALTYARLVEIKEGTAMGTLADIFS